MAYDNQETEFGRIDGIMSFQYGYQTEQIVREYDLSLPHFQCRIDEVDSAYYDGLDRCRCSTRSPSSGWSACTWPLCRDRGVPSISTSPRYHVKVGHSEVEDNVRTLFTI